MIFRAAFFLAASIVGFQWLKSSDTMDLTHAVVAVLLFFFLLVVSYFMAARCRQLPSTLPNIIAYRIFSACVLVSLLDAFIPAIKLFSA